MNVKLALVELLVTLMPAHEQEAFHNARAEIRNVFDIHKKTRIGLLALSAVVQEAANTHTDDIEKVKTKAKNDETGVGTSQSSKSNNAEKALEKEASEKEAQTRSKFPFVFEMIDLGEHFGKPTEGRTATGPCKFCGGNH